MNQKDSKQNIGKEHQEFVSLAVKCKFIDAEQEQKILTCFLSRLAENPDVKIADIFMEFEVLSRDELDFLSSLRNHLKIKHLDILFGKLAVANNFTTPAAINKALAEQTAHFKKTRQHLAIGEILVSGKALSDAERTALLLTQDRIEDEFLEQAIHVIAGNELEKMAINKRFGSIAVARGYARIEDVNQAIRLQNEQKKRGLKPDLLGKILEDSFGMSLNHTLEILKEQKLHEKRRLNLEKALLRYKSEIQSNQMLSRLFEYRVSRDKMEAYVRINKDYEEIIPAGNLINWVKLMGIRYGFVDTQRIDQFLLEGIKGADLKIAQGTPPLKGTDASITFCFDTSFKEHNSTGHNPQNSKTVKKGDILALRKPHIDGTPGNNVFGQSLSPPPLDTCDYKCGKGVVLKNDTDFVADVDGVPMLSQNKILFVTPLSIKRETIIIPENFSSEEGNAYQMLNLEINGNINGGAVLKCQNLTMTGNVMGCVQASGDVHIKGEIIMARAGGDTVPVQPVIKTPGNIHVSKAVKNAIIECGRVFNSPNADVVGSEIAARYGIFVKNVYPDGDRPCILKLNHQADTKLAEIQKCIDQKNLGLKILKKEASFREIEELLHHQVQVQDEYREKQNALAYLIKIMGNLDLKNLNSLGTGFDFMEKVWEINPDSETSYAIPKKTKAYDYLEKVQNQIEGLAPEFQIKKVQTLLEENYGMYKASVSATERMEKEFMIKTGLMEKEVRKNQSEIDRKEKGLQELILEKEYLLLQDTLYASNNSLEIRIKNQISKGTIILGQSAKLVMDKTIYGVRLREKKDQFSNRSGIIIEGYFE